MNTSNYIALHDGLYWVFADGRPIRFADVWEIDMHNKELARPINVIVTQRLPVGDMTGHWRRL